MEDAFNTLFASNAFMPHGVCYLWSPGLLWLLVGSDTLIGLSYFMIPAALLYYVRHTRAAPFPWLFGLFAAFIILCGSTHLIQVWTTWQPMYWFEGGVKLLTGVISFLTALALIHVLPQALKLKTPRELEREVTVRTADLARANQKLAEEIDARKNLELMLVREREKAQITLLSIGDAVITTDDQGYVEFLNSAAEKLTGWTLKEAEGRPLMEVFNIINEYTRQPVENPVTHILKSGEIVKLAEHTLLISRLGQEFAIQDSAAPIRNREGRTVGAVLVSSDISEQRSLSQELAYRITHDILTGLVNRSEFEMRLQHLIERAQMQGEQHSFLYLDIDQLKIINDTSGNTAGDELLRQVTEVFRDSIRQRDTLARIGGDEFGILLEHCEQEQAVRIANKLLQSTEKFRFDWEGKIFAIGVSIGLVIIDASSTDLGQVLSAADHACYVAKEAGRRRVHIYHEDDVHITRYKGELQIIADLQQDIDENRLQLYAQPIVPIHDSATYGYHFELLLRLKRDQQIIPPSVFLAAAERYYFATHIDHWVVETALRTLSEHPRFLQKLALCTINLSGQSLADPSFQDFVLSQLNNSGISPEKIGFEITETAAIANFKNAIRFIETLKYQGCRFALDDFGSGLSSFAYLKKLPVDYLKIDGFFVKDIVEDLIARAMVRSINEIGHVMNKKTIAEYVENEAILEQLRILGVNYAQGYGIAHPCLLDHLLARSER